MSTMPEPETTEHEILIKVAVNGDGLAQLKVLIPSPIPLHIANSAAAFLLYTCAKRSKDGYPQALYQMLRTALEHGKKAAIALPEDAHGQTRPEPESTAD